MANIIHRNYFNRALLHCLFGVVSITHAIPMPVSAAKTQSVSNVAFLHRIENLIKKMKGFEMGNNKDSIYDTLIELKSEIEFHTGKRIDIPTYIDMAERELAKKGVKIPHKQIKEIKNALQKKDKKNKNNNKRLASMLQINEYELDTETQELFFLS